MIKLFKPIFPSKDLNYSPTYKNPYTRISNGFSVIGQLFGGMPTDSWLRQKYIELGLSSHNGLDLACVKGTPVFSAHKGKVIRISLKESSGLGVMIESEDGSFFTLYWHFTEVLVKIGQEVRELDLIGLGDSTGISNGHHLHFGLYLKGTPKDNGVDGASDPLPYIIETPHFAFNNNLWLGKSGEDVRNLQIALANEGFLGGVGFAGFTGYFGTQTLKAVKLFQYKYGIINTGFVGKLTRAKLNSIK